MLHPRAVAASAALAVLLWAYPARADLVDLKWSTEGYYRTRSVYLTNLAAQPAITGVLDPVTGEEISMPQIRRTSYVFQRLRVMPSLSYAKLATLNMQVDALDDVLWGDNNGISTAPLFATESSSQHFLGGKVGDSVTVPRAWLQFNVPVGLMRVGRQPSHWGMGLLANGGGTGNIDTLSPPPPGEPARPAQDHFFANDFGDSHFGSTADRVLFVTRPISIFKTITKAKNKESKLIVGYAYDKLSEAPFLPKEGFAGNYRPFGQQGFISRRGGDDVNEHVALAVYSDPDWDQIRYTDQLRVGIYTVLRTSKRGSTFPSELPDLVEMDENCSGEMGVDDSVPCVDTGSKVYIVDLWYKLMYGPWYSEAELIHIGGKTFGGVPFPGANKLKRANINGGVARFGYMAGLWDGILEVGYSSGDDWLEDGTLRQRALHPDFNVGLILFEEILREQTARAFLKGFISEENPEGAQGLMSRGGVINARYLHPKVRWRPGLPGVEVVGALLAAWADKLPRTGATLNYLPLAGSAGSYYGTEADLALKANFSGKMMFSLETGYLLYGPALKEKLNRADGSFTLQTRIAFMW